MAIFSPTTARNAVLAVQRASNLLVNRGGQPLSAQQIQQIASTLVTRQGLSFRDLTLLAEQAVFGFQLSAGPPAGPAPGVVTASTSAVQPPVAVTAGGSMSIQLSAASRGLSLNGGSPVTPVVSAGIFGTIGRILKGAAGGILGGPAGVIGGAIGGAIGGGTARPGTGLPATIGLPPTLPGFGTFAPQLPPQQAPPQRKMTLFPPTVTTFFPPQAQPTPQIAQVGAVGGCPSGHHPNKTAYWTQAGFVAKGSKCVRNRRRNPMNPRALSRAIGRIESAKKASKRIGRISIRKACK